jgi:hypothetical protein
VSSVATPATPFRGLAPYSEQDAGLFFGRERERRIVVASLDARPLTLVFGPSGAGKSSLLRAGVAVDLRLRAEAGTGRGEDPATAVVVHSAWRYDPVQGVVAAVRKACEQQLGDSSADSRAVSLGDACAELGAELYLILDQLEEFFLYHAGEDALVAELANALGRRDVNAHVLVSIREDSLGALDRWAQRLPDLFKGFIRIDPLDREAAREAIVRPLERYAALTGVEKLDIEPQLVDAVLDELSVGTLGVTGLVEDAARQRRVDTPYLQLVMERLWHTEQSEGSSVLRLATLERLGGAQSIVRRHLDEALAGLTAHEQELAERAFRFLVTPSGAKIALTAADLASFIDASPEELTSVLERLADARIVRAVEPEPGAGRRFEIFHDVLGPAIRDWRTRRGAARTQHQLDNAYLTYRSLKARLRVAVAACAVLAAAVVVLAVALVR